MSLISLFDGIFLFCYAKFKLSSSFTVFEYAEYYIHFRLALFPISVLIIISVLFLIYYILKARKDKESLSLFKPVSEFTTEINNIASKFESEFDIELNELQSKIDLELNKINNVIN